MKINNPTNQARVAGRSITAIACLLLLTFNYSFSQKFTILGTSDEHSVLLPLPLTDYHPAMKNPALGGYARLATLVNNIREEKGDEPVLLFSSGDIIGGTPFAWLILEGYSPEIELMGKIGYNAMTIGNHEFDYGPDLLAEYFLRAGYPFNEQNPRLIASNLKIPEGHKLLDTGIEEHYLFDLSNGLTIGVFGLLGKAAYDVAGFAEPVEVYDQHSVAAKQVSLLRYAGADIVVALTHSGIAEDRQLARKVSGIDIILGGHDHYITPEPEKINNTIIIHSGYNLEKLGILELELDSDTGELLLVNSRNGTPYHKAIDSSIDEDPAILEMTDVYLEKLNEFISVQTDGMFGDVAAGILQMDFSMRRELPFTETTVGNFVTDAMRLMSEEITGEKVHVAFQGDGVIRSDIVPGTMEWSDGMVSFFDLVTVSGLGSGKDSGAGYPLVSLYLTEKEIYNVLEISSLLSQFMGDIYFLQVSGIRFSHDPGKATWLKVPVLNIPVPAYRSVLNAELYAGEGIQDDDNYIPIDKEGERLYHVVTDYYLTSFLPMVGEILPKLGIVLKDRHGNQLEIDQTLILNQGKEFKVWEAVARYAVSLDTDSGEMPVMPDYYSNTSGRITLKAGVPLKYWSYLALVLTLILLYYLIRFIVIKIRLRRQQK
jgi:5'-nucleotidase / UDP-sugar diphosphatase